MEMVDKDGTPIYENWFTSNLPMTFHWNGQDVELVEIARRSPTEEEYTKMKLKTLCIDAKDIILCPNGQILFKVEE